MKLIYLSYDVVACENRDARLEVRFDVKNTVDIMVGVPVVDEIRAQLYKLIMGRDGYRPGAV